MTYNDLRAEVAALGFESEIELSNDLLRATQRALRMIFTERPLYKTVQFFQNSIKPIIKIESLAHCGGVTDSVSFNAKAYSFRTTGEGTYTIVDGSEKRTVDFSGIESLHKGFLYGNGTLEFLGAYSYTVYDLAIFDEILSSDEKDIPVLCDFIEYDVKSYAGDFLTYSSPPENELGIPIPNASVCGGKMRIPVDYTGKIRLLYKAAPTSISGDGDEDIILPDGCEHLLALVVAAFVWLDDDGEKAQYYMNLYREAMAAVKFYDRAGVNPSYQDVIGWT